MPTSVAFSFALTALASILFVVDPLGALPTGIAVQFVLEGLRAAGIMPSGPP